MIVRNTVDVSCIIIGHSESYLVAATIKSVLRACEYANTNGISTEVVLVLDSPDANTASVVEDYFVDCLNKIVTVDYKDLGVSRNHGAEISRGKYLSFIDGDDLWGENWLLDSFMVAEGSKKTVYHPEYNIYFGEKDSHVFQHVDMASHDFELEAIYRDNYWTALAFSTRSTFLDQPYSVNRIKNGFGYEDWTWNVELIKQGYLHKIVPGTCHFIRRTPGENSLLKKTNASGSIPRILPIYERGIKYSIEGSG